MTEPAQGHRSMVDTNLFVYAYDAGAGPKRAAVRTLLDSRGRSGELALSTQVLSEFYVTVTRKLAKPLPAAEAAAAVRDLSALPLLPIDAAVVRAAVARSQADKLSYWDALLIETARAGGCSEVLTEDLQDGRAYDGLRIRNPLRA